MYTFEITIQRKSGDGWPVVVEQSVSGVFLPVRDEGALQLELTELASQTTPEAKSAIPAVNTLCGEALDRSFDTLAFGHEPRASDGRCPCGGLAPKG